MVRPFLQAQVCRRNLFGVDFLVKCAPPQNPSRDRRLIVHSRSRRQGKSQRLRHPSVLPNMAALARSSRSTPHQAGHTLYQGCHRLTSINQQHSGPRTVLFNWTSTRHHTRSAPLLRIFPSSMVSPRSLTTLVFLTCVKGGIPSQ